MRSETLSARVPEGLHRRTRQLTLDMQYEEEMKRVFCSNMCTRPFPNHIPFQTHTVTRLDHERKHVCYCASNSPPLIFLLVLATERDWANILRDQTVTTPRPLIWVLTDNPISIFPALRKKERKQKHLELIIFTFRRNAFMELRFKVMPVQRADRIVYWICVSVSFMKSLEAEAR